MDDGGQLSIRRAGRLDATHPWRDGFAAGGAVARRVPRLAVRCSRERGPASRIPCLPTPASCGWPPATTFSSRSGPRSAPHRQPGMAQHRRHELVIGRVARRILRRARSAASTTARPGSCYRQSRRRTLRPSRRSAPMAGTGCSAGAGPAAAPRVDRSGRSTQPRASRRACRRWVTSPGFRSTSSHRGSPPTASTGSR